MIKKYDHQNKGTLNKDDFIEMIRSIDSSLREIDIEFIFEQLDEDGSGFISIPELMDVKFLILVCWNKCQTLSFAQKFLIGCLINRKIRTFNQQNQGIYKANETISGIP